MHRIEAPNFPKGDVADHIKFLLQYGVLAPSTHNTQPWHFKIGGDQLVIKPDHSRALPQADPSTRNLFVSLGACVENIVLAASQFGYQADVASVTNQAITVNFKPSKSPAKPDRAVLDAIERRHSHKYPYKSDAIQPHHLKALNISHIANAEILFIQDSETIRAVAALHQQTIEKLGKDTMFGKELAQWLRDNKGHYHDGMPGMVTGIKGPALYVIRALIRRLPKMIAVLGKKDYAVLSTSPVIGVVATAGNTVTDWVNAGRVYEAAAIAATANGVYSAPLTAMMEDPGATTELKQIFKTKTKIPQVFLRFGYGTARPVYSPRRPISEVLQ